MNKYQVSISYQGMIERWIYLFLVALVVLFVTPSVGIAEPEGGRPAALQSAAEFGTTVEKSYALPMPYSQLKNIYRASLANYQARFITAPLTFAPRPDAVEIACPLSDPDGLIMRYNDPANWARLAYLAESYRMGSVMTKGDPSDPALSGELMTAYLIVAKHILKKANSTNFGGIKYTDPVSGIKKNPIGWNNLASPWDGWHNGTCTPTEMPNLWASGLALMTLASAYKESGDPEFLSGFYGGSIYWHVASNLPIGPSSGYYADPTINSTLYQKLSKNRPFQMTRLYTVGASRFSRGQTNPNKLIVQYHYHEDDPGYFATNITGVMGLAMTLGGIAHPQGGFQIANGSGGFVRRSWQEIGYYALLGTAKNISIGNLGYSDIDSISFSNKKYEAHQDFTIWYFARAGGLLNDATFKNIASRTVKKLVTTPPTGMKIYLPCLHRQLDPAIAQVCKKEYTRLYGANYSSLAMNEGALFAGTASIYH